jgi:prepilin-type N-terminal cleavage/methylation domain-containing protein
MSITLLGNSESGGGTSGGQSFGSRAGFTLIELMFALAIFMIIALGTASTIINVARNAGLSRKIMLASNMCQSKVEELKSLGYLAVLNSDELHIDEQGNAGGIFTRTVRVSNGTIPNTKLVLVTVSWTNLGLTKSVSFPTLIVNIVS